MRAFRFLFPLILVLPFAALPALAADRAKLAAFLEVTGFDVAIESLQVGAMQGPALAGDAPSAFGREWVRLAEEVFDPASMVGRGLDMLEAVMPDDLVDHGAAFYASDLGQRLVAIENEAHMAPDEEKYAEGDRLLGELLKSDPDRIEIYRRLGHSVGGVETAVRSAIEIQVRYLMAAMAAGVSDLGMSEEDLRASLSSQADAIRQNIEIYGLLNSAYTYRDFSDEEMLAYVEALEDERMQQVYEILNAVQFEIMAERYEQLATALAGLKPQVDL